MTSQDVPISFEDQLFDRQVRVWGTHGQRRLRQARLLVLGSSATIAETLKNLLISGIHSYTIVDDALTSDLDLATNIFLTQSMIGMTKCDAISKSLEDLNPQCIARALCMPITDAVFDILSSTNASSTTTQEIPRHEDGSLAINHEDCINIHEFSTILIDIYRIPLSILTQFASVAYRLSIPIICVASMSLYSYVKIISPPRITLETKSGHERIGEWYINLSQLRRFPGFIQYAFSTQFDYIDDFLRNRIRTTPHSPLNTSEHTHTPFIVLLVRSVRQYMINRDAQKDVHHSVILTNHSDGDTLSTTQYHHDNEQNTGLFALHLDGLGCADIQPLRTFIQECGGKFDHEPRSRAIRAVFDLLHPIRFQPHFLEAINLTIFQEYHSATTTLLCWLAAALKAQPGGCSTSQQDVIHSTISPARTMFAYSGLDDMDTDCLLPDDWASLTLPAWITPITQLSSQPIHLQSAYSNRDCDLWRFIALLILLQHQHLINNSIAFASSSSPLLSPCHSLLPLLIVVYSIRLFIMTPDQGNGCLPLQSPGLLPDIVSTTAQYRQIQQIYSAKHAEDMRLIDKNIRFIVHRIQLASHTIRHHLTCSYPCIGPTPTCLPTLGIESLAQLHPDAVLSQLATSVGLHMGPCVTPCAQKEYDNELNTLSDNHQHIIKYIVDHSKELRINHCPKLFFEGAENDQHADIDDSDIYLHCFGFMDFIPSTLATALTAPRPSLTCMKAIHAHAVNSFSEGMVSYLPSIALSFMAIMAYMNKLGCIPRTPHAETNTMRYLEYSISNTQQQRLFQDAGSHQVVHDQHRDSDHSVSNLGESKMISKSSKNDPDITNNNNPRILQQCFHGIMAIHDKYFRFCFPDSILTKLTLQVPSHTAITFDTVESRKVLATLTTHEYTEIGNVASITAGIATDLILKLALGQYTLPESTVIYDGFHSRGGVLQL